MILHAKSTYSALLAGFLAVVCTTFVTAGTDSWQMKFQRGFLEHPQQNDVHFTARIGLMQVWCRSNGFSIVTFSRSDERVQTQRLDIEFGSQPARIIPLGQRAEYYRIIRNSNATVCRAFEIVRYIGVADGVDLQLRWSPTGLKYDVLVSPGGDLASMRLRVCGGRLKPLCDHTGALRIESGTEEFLDAAPVAFQPAPDGSTKSVDVRYSIINDTTFGYRIVGSYDPTLPIVIDPAIVWSSYLGGSQEDAANDLTIDGTGNIYVCGNSLSIDFPLRGTSANRGRQNMVIAKFSASGQHLWSTYFGGERDEVAKTIVWDGSSQLLYVGGWSSSPSVILDAPFPNRAGGAFDAVVLAFTTDGTFVRGTFLGGSREELINALAVRRDGSLVAVGRTNSRDFPIAQAQQATITGDNDIFVTVLALPTLSVLWSTYYGGTAFDEAYGVTTSPTGSVFVTGVTVSTDFPTANAYQPVAQPLDNAFVLALSSSGRRLWSTYLGGSDYDLGNRIVYWNGSLILAGTTSSSDFPIIGDSIAQREKSGFNDAFIASFRETGEFLWSTFWGGRAAESGFSLCVLNDGSIALAGSTSSPDFPRRRSILWEPRGGDDVFVALFRNGQNRWSATFGGSGDDILAATALLPSGDIIGIGETRSRDFAPLVNAQYQPNPSPGNRSDCFVFRLCTFSPIVETAESTRTLCNGKPTELWASDSSQIASITWNTGSTANRITITEAGKYWFVATSRSGCTTYSDTIEFKTATSSPLLLDTIAPRRSLYICDGERLGLVVRGRYRNYAWLDSTGMILSTSDTLWITTSGTFQAFVEDTNGCILHSASHRVERFSRPALSYRRIESDGSTTEISQDSITACMGDAVEVELAASASIACRWSDGLDRCRRVVTSDMQLSAVVIDSNGCQWTMRPLTVHFTDRQRPSIQVLDTVCIGTPFTVRVLDSNGKVQWRVPSPFESLSSSADSSIRTFQAHRVGVYDLSVWFASQCTDTATASVVVVAPPALAITASAQRLCPGQQIILSAPGGFREYHWNGRQGDSTIAITDTGWYRVEIVTRHGCSAQDSIYIGQWESLTLSPTAIDYGVVERGQSAQATVLLHNPTDTIAAITIQLAQGTAFRIVSPGPLPLKLGADTLIVLDVEFQPTIEGDATDTLIVARHAPCVDTLRVVLHGVGIVSNNPFLIAFDVDDVTISPTDQTVVIPIYAWSVSSQIRRIDSLTIDMSYNPTMLLPVRLTPGRFSNLPFQKGRGWIRATIPLDSVPTIARSMPITLLEARVLIGDREEDSVTIEHATAEQVALEYQSASGTVRYSGLCRAGGIRLVGQVLSQRLRVVPNPTNGDASIIVAITDNGTHILRLMTADARILWEYSFDVRAGHTVAIPLPSDLPSGVVTVLVTSASGTIATGAVILR